MKKIILAVFCLGLAVFAAASIWLAVTINSVKNPGPLPETKIVLIERGMGVSAIAQTLQNENVIGSALAFKIDARLSDDQRPLKAGEYEFTPHITAHDAITMMRDGRIYSRKISIPEGRTSWQVVEALRALTDIDGEIADIPEEGTLLPDTYHYIRTDSRADVLSRMKGAMEKAVTDLWPSREEGLPFKTEAEALALASIVEKETGVAAERARIAGVFVNRLRLGMPLQSDPTVIYAMTKGEIMDEGQGPIGRRLLTRDLSMESPYNTYQNSGLPPGPIANPGRAAIEATLHPEKHDFLYFVADGTGGHVFARTLAEHNRNAANWRKHRRTMGR